MLSDGFALLDEFARVHNPQRWMLVGGLMVHVHAMLAGIDSNRPTSDADVVVEIQAGSDYAAAAHAARSIGFEPAPAVEHRALSYRFTRDAGGTIDIMAPDRAKAVRFERRPVLQVPASSSAAKHLETGRTPTGTEIRVPTLSGALALKGAASMTPAPTRSATTKTRWCSSRAPTSAAWPRYQSHGAAMSRHYSVDWGKRRRGPW